MNPPVLDEAQYRHEVLGLSAESEEAQAQQLAEEAQQLGLTIPRATAPVAVMDMDLTSPVLSSGSSDRNSMGGSVTPSHEPASPSIPPLDPIVSGLSQVTLASRRLQPGSTRSLASTRPTSFCSSEGRVALAGYGYNNDMLDATSKRHSMLSVASADKKEKRRSSFRSAIGRIHFRRKRPSSTLLPEAPGTVPRSGYEPDHVFSDPEPRVPEDAPTEQGAAPLPRLEIPLYSQESLQRSLDDPELAKMSERHRLERDRHVGFQEAALNILRRRHETAVLERQSDNRRQEEEKREKNIDDIVRLEERQLAVEIEQQRVLSQCEPTTVSRRRLKPSQRSSESFSESDSTAPARVFTRQHMEQLEQQYHSHESMDKLHDARIKVLRDRQELKLQEAIARTEQELDDLCNRHTKEIATLKIEHRQEEISLTAGLQSKEKTLCKRWHLEEAVLRRRLELRDGQLYGPLPPLPFSPSGIPTSDSPPPDLSNTPDTIHPDHESVPF
ncbi:unnamed protein product [Penicillium olsonii]|nr:unnamed protein product [Penicillium olsonii]